jgi:probable phosphoglycerate mutase
MPAAAIAMCGFEHGIRQITGLGITGHPRAT